MSSFAVRSVVAPAALMLLAGTCFGQFTYNGGSPNGTEWSRAANWAGNNGPAFGGGTDVIVTMGAAPANRRALNHVDLTNAQNPVFNLNRLIFTANTGGGYDLDGSTLRFNNSAVNGPALIQHDTNDVQHFIDNPIVLNTNLLFTGAANNVNATPSLRLDGVISQAGNINYGLTFLPTQAAMTYRLGGVNTYAGTTTLNNGVLILTGMSNTGTGAFVSGSANGNHVQTIAALSGRNAVMSNSTFEMTSTINIGQTNAAAATLRVNGEFRPGAGAGQSRTVNLRGGRNHELVLAGEILTLGALVFNGDTAPVIEKGKILDRRQAVGNLPAAPKNSNLGSVVRITGEQLAQNPNNRTIANMKGALTIQNATLSVECKVGAANNRIANDWTIGAPNMPAALIGRAVQAGNNVDPARIFFAANNGVKVKAGSILQPGASPGVMALNGGLHEFEPDSNFGVTLNGVLSGNGDGFYSQLMLEEGAAVSLACSPTNVRPILGVDLQTVDTTGSFTNFSPLIGMSFTIIDQDSPFAPSLYNPADQFGYGGNMFMTPDGNALADGVYFYNEALPSGLFFQIDYHGGDTGNDVVLTIVPVPTPGAGAVLALGGLASARRRRR